MSKSLNEVRLIGNVGQAPTIKTMADSTRKVASFTLATNESWTDKNSVKHDKVQWHRISAWSNANGDGLAGIVERFVNKGDRLYVGGKVEYREVGDRDAGDVKYYTDIIANDIILLGGRADGDHAPAAKAAPARGGDALGDEDDDLPF